MQSNSQAKIKRPTDYLYTLCVLSVTCTPSKKVLIFVIIFFTILHATWLVYLSQVEKYPSVHDNYYATSIPTPTPTPTPSYPLSSTVTVISRKEIKDASSNNFLVSKLTQNAK